MDITYICGLGILIHLFFEDPTKKNGLQPLELDKTSEMYILKTT
jgi:hypothetical protein